MTELILSLLEQERLLYLQEQCDKIKGAVIIGIETEIRGETVLLKTVKVKHSNGDEFVIRPYDWQQLHVIQILWGEYGEAKTADL